MMMLAGATSIITPEGLLTDALKRWHAAAEGMPRLQCWG